MLVFRTSPEAPVLWPIEISRRLKHRPELRVHIGIHSGPASGVVDVSERTNVARAALLRLDPMFDPLRNDPRFQKLCEENAK